MGLYKISSTEFTKKQFGVLVQLINLLRGGRGIKSRLLTKSVCNIILGTLFCLVTKIWHINTFFWLTIAMGGALFEVGLLH